MADKIKRISINAFEKAVDNMYVPTTTVEWNGLNIVVKKHLSLAEVARFVDVCAKACFNPEDNSYAPEAKDVAIRSCIVLFYTNITLPSNLESQYKLIYRSDVLSSIIPCVDKSQLDAVIQAIDEKIDYLANANTDFLKKQVNDLFSTLNGLEDQMKDVFGGVSQEDIKGVIDALSNGALDEEKLVKAIVNNK